MSETLARIFAEDPLKLTTDDVSAIVQKMREHRAQYELGGKTKVAERNTPAKRLKKIEDLLGPLGLGPTGEPKPKADPSADLKELGLD